MCCTFHSTFKFTGEMLYCLIVFFVVLPMVVRGPPIGDGPFQGRRSSFNISSTNENTSTSIMPATNVTTTRRVKRTDINVTDLHLYNYQCKRNNIQSVTSIFTRGDMTVQIVQRRNGTDAVVGKVAAEYLVGTFLLLIAVCLIIWAFYVALVFYVKHMQQRSFVTALQTVNAGFP